VLERCYGMLKQVEKNAFVSVSAFSTEQNFICGDPEGVIKWIEGEVEAFLTKS
jgi:hypothetical protein